MSVKLEGFQPASAEVLHRLLLSIWARGKKGKTHFALTAPGPIAFFNFDDGIEGVIDKFIDLKEILISQFISYRVFIDDTTDADIQAENTQLWLRFKKEFNRALKHPDVRTIIIDTATEAWELCRMVKLGKIAQVKPHHYGPVNAEFRDIVRWPLSYNKNVIFIHKAGPEYINEARTGKYERSGFSGMEFLAQTEVQLTKTDGEFEAKIDFCRLNPGIEGEVLSGPMCNFKFLAMNVFPDSVDKEWE